MRRKEPTIDRDHLDKIADGKVKPLQRVLLTNGEPVCQGLFVRKRGRKLLWLFRYRTPAGDQRELALGFLSDFGVRGRLAQFGPAGDIAAELRTAKGAREPVPAEMIGDIARRVRALIDGGSDPVADRKAGTVQARREASGHRLGDYAEQFLALGVKRRGGFPLRAGTIGEYRRALIVHAAPLHDRDVREITTVEVAELIKGLATKRGRICAARTRSVLSRLFGWLASQGIVQHGNPVQPTETFANEPGDRVLSDDELKALWAWCEATDSDYSRIIRLILWTGLRRGEVSGVHSSELTADGALLLPRERVKNNRALLLPLPRQAQEAIAHWRGADAGHLFGREEGRPFSGYSKSLARCVKALGFSKDWSLHDLRRTVETRMASVRVSQEIINRVMNHAVGSITKTYNLYDYRAEKAEALQRWADELDRITGIPAPDNVVQLKRA
jgi:integrase